MQTGRMIAYYPAPNGPGIRFEPLTTASVAGFVAARFSAPLYSRDWVVANGSGHLILGDRGFDINSYDLDDGNLTLRAANLLAFDASLELKQSIVPGFLTLIGTGKFLASSSRPGDLRGAADPGGPAGARGLGGLPVAVATTTTRAG